eukprot:12707274-Alexandrium_andersonii.AAC.1
MSQALKGPLHPHAPPPGIADAVHSFFLFGRERDLAPVGGLARMHGVAFIGSPSERAIQHAVHAELAHH